MELESATVLGLGGLAIGFVLGGVTQRTNFCTLGGISDYVLMGEGSRLRAWALATAVAIIGTQALAFTGHIDINKSIYLTANMGWLGAIFGGLIFGYGMTKTGGCALRTLVRLGAGNLKSLVVLLVIASVAYMTLRGIIAPLRLQIETTNLDLATKGIASQNMGDIAAKFTGVAAATMRMAFAVVVPLILLVWCFKDAEFRSNKRDIFAGLVVGACTIAGWVVTGILAADEFTPVPLGSTTFVAPIAEGLQYLMTWTGATFNFGIALAGGVLAGSLLTALAFGKFRLESFADQDDLLRHLGGAFLMGIGGVTALGCTIGQGTTGMSTLALSSLLTWASIYAGGYVGIKQMEEGSFLGALKACFSRG